MKLLTKILSSLWKAVSWIGGSFPRKPLDPPWIVTVTEQKHGERTIAVNVPDLSAAEIVADLWQARHGTDPLLFKVIDRSGTVVASCRSFEGRPVRDVKC